MLDRVELRNQTLKLVRIAARIQMVVATLLFGMTAIATFQVPQQKKKTVVQELAVELPPEVQVYVQVIYMSNNTKVSVLYIFYII